MGGKEDTQKDREGDTQLGAREEAQWDDPPGVCVSPCVSRHTCREKHLHPDHRLLIAHVTEVIHALGLHCNPLASPSSCACAPPLSIFVFISSDRYVHPNKFVLLSLSQHGTGLNFVLHDLSVFACLFRKDSINFESKQSTMIAETREVGLLLLWLQ